MDSEKIRGFSVGFGIRNNIKWSKAICRYSCIKRLFTKRRCMKSRLTCWGCVSQSCGSVERVLGGLLMSCRDQCSDYGTVVYHHPSSYNCSFPVYNAHKMNDTRHILRHSVALIPKLQLSTYYLTNIKHAHMMQLLLIQEYSHIAPNVKLAINKFSITKFPWHFPDFWSISWYFPQNDQISWHSWHISECMKWLQN